MEVALELYFDTNDSYPPANSLAPLVPTFMSVLPSDPGGYSYVYQAAYNSGGGCATTPCDSYLLIASTELPPPPGGWTSTWGGLGGNPCDPAIAVAPFKYCKKP